MDAGVITSIVGTGVTLLALAVGLGRVLQGLSELVRRTARIETRLDGVEGVLTNLRLDVGKIGQQLEDHLKDDRAHARR